MLKGNIPIVPAVATLIAALIAAVVALVVAFVNAWGNRRTAIDTAHREYRKELAESSVAAAQKFRQGLYKLREAVKKGEGGIVNAPVTAGTIKKFRQQPAKFDFRIPDEPVFRTAVEQFTGTRSTARDVIGSVAEKHPEDLIRAIDEAISKTRSLKMSLGNVTWAGFRLAGSTKCSVFCALRPLIERWLG